MSETAHPDSPERPEQTDSGPAAATLPAPRKAPKVKQPRLWNVVILDDEDHSYEYVIEAMQKVFSHAKEKAFKIAETVDKEGRAVCGTFHKELAELKLEQLHAQGKDHRIASCKGAMSSLIEPADAGTDE
jgi:ATP-dependent Clp protease adaptor protein ClpS